MPSPPVTITLSIQDFVDSHLGLDPTTHQHYWHSRPIKRMIADVLIELTGNKHPIFYIQMPEDKAPHLLSFVMDERNKEQPILWDRVKWQESVDNFDSLQRASEDRRNERFVFEENVKRVSRALRKSPIVGDSFDEEQANGVAAKMLLRGERMKLNAICVCEIKYVTKVEEI